MTGAESIYIEKGSEACLLVHGFSGSPSELRPLAEYLVEEGYSVYAPLLPGHGTDPVDLIHTTWHDWYGTVENVASYMSKRYNSIYIIGLSMGGILSLLGAARGLPVKKVISLAAPLFFKERSISAVPLLRYFVPYHHIRKSAQNFGSEDYKRFSYDRMSLKALSSFLKLNGILKRELHKIEVPVMITQSENDRIVDMKSGKYIYDNIGSDSKKLLSLKNSGHIVTMSQEAPELFAEIKNFIEE